MACVCLRRQHHALFRYAPLDQSSKSDKRSRAHACWTHRYSFDIPMYPLMTSASTTTITVGDSVSRKFQTGKLVRTPVSLGAPHEISSRYARTGILHRQRLLFHNHSVLISKGYVWHQNREIVDSRLSSPLFPWLHPDDRHTLCQSMCFPNLHWNHDRSSGIPACPNVRKHSLLLKP